MKIFESNFLNCAVDFRRHPRRRFPSLFAQLIFGIGLVVNLAFKFRQSSG